MHIVQVLPALDEGGVERGVVELNRSLVEMGHQSTVISSGGRLVAKIQEEGGRHLTLPVKSKNPLTAWARALKLRAALRKLSPDVVHYRSRVPGWLCQWANRSLHLPLVSTVHGFNSVNFYSRVMTMGDLVICPSTPIVDYIQRHYVVPDQKIRLIYRGIDPASFNPQKVDSSWMQTFLSQHASPDSFIVLGVGRITQLKGFDLLIRATALAVQRVPHLVTWIVGEAEEARKEYAEELKALAGSLQLGDHLRFVGNQKKMAEIYSLGSVLVSCNHAKPESFGRTMAEALAMGCPVIATRFGGALDIVRDGKDGWLIPPGDVAALADQLVEASRTSFENLRESALARFSLKQMVEKTVSVYEEVIQNKRGVS